MTKDLSSNLLVQILVGIIVGIFVGGYAPQIGLEVKFLGDLFIRALLMLVVPLIIASMVVGIARLGDVRKLGRLGTVTITYYMITTAISVVIGIALVTTIKPGKSFSESGSISASLNQTHQSSNSDPVLLSKIKEKEKPIGELLKEMVVNLIPANLFRSMSNNEVLPLIVFSLFFGAVLTTLGDRGKLLIEIFEGANDAVMKIVHLLMIVSPIGIGALIAGRLGDAGGFEGFLPELIRLGKYVITVVLGLLIHGLIVLPVILSLFAQRNPFEYLRNMMQALMTAISTSSSAATLPVTVECVTENNKVSERTAAFVLPLGATINMDGTALYEAVAAIFIAQMYGIDLGLTQVLIIFLTSSLAAIGAAGIPEAGLVTMVLVLKAAGLPLDGISLILVIDWFLDRCRTTINVWGDAVGAAVVERFCAKK